MQRSICPQIYGSNEDDKSTLPPLSDSEALVLEHRSLIEGIADKYEELGHQDELRFIEQYTYAVQALGRIFQHSIKDGIDLAEMMDVAAHALTDIIANPVFVTKHQAFCQKVLDKLYELMASPWDPGNDLPRPLRALFFQFRALSDSSEGKFGHIDPRLTFPKLTKHMRVTWDDITNLKLGRPWDPFLSNDEYPEIEKIDQHYEQYLQVRRLSAEAPVNAATQIEKAEEHLKDISLVFEGAYYYGDVRALFERQAADEFTRKRIVNYFDQRPAKDFITAQEIEMVAEKLRIDLEPLRGKIEKSRYCFLQQVYLCERELHSRNLEAELKQRLEKRLGRAVPIFRKAAADRFTIGTSDKERANLNEDEAELLALMECVVRPSPELIRNYFEQKSVRPGQKKMFTEGLAEVFNDLFRAYEDFRDACLKTMSAKRDTDIDDLADRFFDLLVEKAYEEAELSRPAGGESEDFELPNPSPIDCLRADNTDEFACGGERLLTDTREVFRTNQRIEGPIITKIFGSYDDERRRWGKSYFEVNQEWDGGNEEIEFTISETPVGTPIKIPKPLPGQIKQIDQVANAVQNELGEVTGIPQNDKGVSYTVITPEESPIMKDISAQEYSEFRQNFIDSYGDDLARNLAPMNEEVELFLQSIESLPPLEKVMRIEEYVRAVGYYDVKNDQVARKKIGKSVSRQLAVMETRMNQLCRRGKDIPKSKRYAGICADFANLTIAILRKAGFLAGIAGSFVSDEKIFRMKNSHATAFVVWPEGNENRIFIVDGTPASTDPRLIESEIRSLRRRNASAKSRKEVEELEKELDLYLGNVADDQGEVIMRQRSLTGMTDETLKKLLKRISRYALSEQGLQRFNAQLGLYLYSPMHDCDIARRQDRSVLAQEVKKLSSQEVEGSLEGDLSNYVYDLVNGFLRRVLESGFVRDEKEARSLMRLIVRSAEQLEAIDKKAVRLIAKHFFDSLGE